jgi:hypothetical protein
MLIVAPLLISYKMDDATSRREILMDVTLFIDKIRDIRMVTDAELDDFYTQCNSHGLAVDVRVRRMVKYVLVDDEGLAVVDYYFNDNPEALLNFNKGDGIQVIVREVGISPARNYMYSVFGAENGPLNFALAGIVG